MSKIFIKSKSIISMIVCAVMLLLTTSAYASSTDKFLSRDQLVSTINSISSAEYESNPHLFRYVSELKDFINDKKNVTTEDIYTHFKDSDTYNNYKNYKLNSKSKYSISESDRTQLARVDALAKEYYDYYIKNGSFPESSNNVSTFSVGIVALLAEIGLSLSESAVATRLASLGIVSGIGTSMPSEDFFAALVGAAIFTAYIPYYALHTTAIQNDIYYNEGYSYSVNTASTMTQVILMKDAVAYNMHHFAAIPNNGPGGGVILTAQITFAQAVSRGVLGLDTWSNGGPSAYQVAAYVDISGIPVHHYAHNTTVQPFNRPHWHASTNGGSLIAGHHWY